MDIDTQKHAAQDKQTLLREKLNLETAQINWRSLQRFFASGHVLWVADNLDLVDVACRMAQDDHAEIKQWQDAGVIASVSDKQALAWYDSDAVLWTVVVRPWVLVQVVQEPR